MRRACACLAVVLAGCAAAPVPRDSSLARSRLADAETRAAAAVRSGNYDVAARDYDEALRLATSLENADAAAANAVNLSIVYQWLGRDADARAALAPILEDPRKSFPERRLVQAELRRAILDLAAANTGAAAVWAAQADQRCARLSCEHATTILNVRAQIELGSGRPAEALSLAQAAADRARGGEPAEAGNALRITGRARRALGEPQAALTALTQALEIDRDLGDPRRILADLTELARAAEAAGDKAAARDYRDRALAVSRAIRGAAAGDSEPPAR